MEDNYQHEEFRDTIATVKDGKRVWLHPKKPQGKLYNFRTIATVIYLFVFFSLPLIKVDGHPFFLINIIERKFILFGQIFWPQDFFIFGIGMILSIVLFALFTVVFGRVFCGWLCPQTIFMEMIFRKIEYAIEGDSGSQKRLAQAPWNSEKVFKKSIKWFIFWIVSFIIANTFLAYIIGIDELYKIITEPLKEHLGGFSAIVIFTTIFFLVYSWFREQVCVAVCPYGRLQGVLLDKNSIVVAYDYKRGEQRAKYKKNEVRTQGDCIDCNQCVQVCPTGIDIRNGTQLECVNCTACIDACNKMMEAVNLPQNLIRYASENNIAHGTKTRFTGRMKAYTGVMILLIGLLSYLILSRSDVGVNIMRTGGQLYQEQPNNKLSNLYSFTMLNKTYAEKDLNFKIENLPGEIKIIGDHQLKVPTEGTLKGTMFIILDKQLITQRKIPLEIGVYENNKKIQTIKTNFLGPFS